MSNIILIIVLVSHNWIRNLVLSCLIGSSILSEKCHMSRLVSLSTEQLCTERAEGSGYQGWLTRSRNGSFRQGGTSCKKSYLAGENRFPFYGNVVVIIISDAWVRDASQFTDWESMEHEVTCSRPIYYLHHTYE